jgi:hypothetical protein
MKQVAIIFLIFIYAFSSTGVAVKADYCCNNLKSIKLVLADAAKDKEGCCKVKYQTFKVKDVHAATDAVSVPVLHFNFIHSINLGLHADDLVYEINHHSVNIHAPPLYQTTPVYISNCVFRI